MDDLDKPSSSDSLQADLILNEAKARAAEVLTDIMENSENDNTRLTAAKAILAYRGEQFSEKDWDSYRKSVNKDE